MTKAAAPRVSHSNAVSGASRAVKSGCSRITSTVAAEVRPVADIEITLHRQSLGQDHVVARQFHVEVRHLIPFHLRDARAVDQQLHRHQHVVHEHRVIGRQIKIPHRNVLAKRAGRDAHRPHRLRPSDAPGNSPPVAQPKRSARARHPPAITRSPTASVSTAHEPVRRLDPRPRREARHDLRRRRRRAGLVRATLARLERQRPQRVVSTVEQRHHVAADLSLATLRPVNVILSPAL